MEKIACADILFMTPEIVLTLVTARHQKISYNESNSVKVQGTCVLFTELNSVLH